MVDVDRRMMLSAWTIAGLTISPLRSAIAATPLERPQNMSDLQANKRLIRSLINDVWIGGHLDNLSLYWTTDCVNHADPAPDKTGLAALRRYHESFGPFFASFADVEIVVQQQVAEGDRVVTQMLASMTHKAPFMDFAPTGRRVSLATIRMDRCTGGKIAEHWSVADLAGLIAQIKG